ncbi:Sensory transduction histidine kinase [Pedobacter cryoconitis]|uniref:histidine kinase n=1 Tax=Pedobacter cryoconitis TaxID=188932 RepID=A0A127VC54_9SPHI|nr:PAS domain S-box protein [Pedobacter cryoconitis]AMP98761.1 Sensory transduction histidine kinase [Pedobacter cryoconitis]
MLSFADLNNILNNSPVSMAILDLDRRFQAVSNQWLVINGLEGVQVVGKLHSELFPVNSHKWQEIFDNCLLGINYQGETKRIDPADQSKIWIKWQINQWTASTSGCGGFVLYCENITEIKSSKHQEAQFRVFMDYIPGLCWITNSANVLTYANKHFLNTHHLPSTVIGKNKRDIFGYDVAADAFLNNSEILKTKKNKEFQQTIRDQDGFPQYFMTFKFPFLDSSGNMSLVGAVCFNITKHKQLEENLYQSEEQFRRAFEHSLVGMALISPEGCWKRVNASLCLITGYTEQELQSMCIQDITHPDDLPESIAKLIDLANNVTESLKVEKRYIHKNGDIIWVVIAATMLKDSQGRALHYVSQIEDITKRKEIEGDLKQSEKKYRSIFENVQDVFYQADQAGLVTEISPSILQYSGFSREAIIGQPVSDFYYYPQDRTRIINSLKNDGTVIDFEVRLKTADKELRYVSVNARLILEDGRIAGTEGSMRDVTARKFQENALKALNLELTASNEQKNKLLSIIGHDLRNPISSSLELLEMTLADLYLISVDDIHLHLSMIKQELSNANELLEGLLIWAKSQFNAIGFHPVEIADISNLIERSAHNVLPMANKKSIRIVHQIEPGLGIYADKEMLETIVRNLLSNAIKFSHTGGEITINVLKKGNDMLFSVADNGIGVPAEKVLELLNSKSNYTTYGTNGEKGTGLGLNLVVDFVLRHGGKIWVNSNLGIGSVFYFTIPFVE